jgi:hypothetical protein
MGLPRIVYNSINLDFPRPLSDYRVGDVFRGGKNTADGGLTETVRAGTWDRVTIAMETFSQASFYRDLVAWWAWASRGKQYSFALDRDKVVNTTMVNAESAGATVIELVSITGIAAGYYQMISADRLSREIVEVQSAGGGAATLVTGTKYAYSAGDVFRDINFWPKCVTADDERPFVELPVLAYSFRHVFLEDRA